MKSINKQMIGLCLLLASSGTVAQVNETAYDIELFGAAATGDFTPFWMTSNRYGIVPLEANNGYLRAGVLHNQTFGQGFYWSAGLDLVGVVPRYRNAYIHQLYAEIGYKSLQLSVGSKEQTSPFGLDSRLSSGDVIRSMNARPIPEVSLSLPHFVVVPATKGWLQLKGSFSVGRSFDNDYLKDFVNPSQTYVKDVLWHHKSLYFQIKDTKNKAPLSGTIGIQHIAQWGGTSTNPKIGKQPHSFKDFLRIVCGKEGGGDATISDQINVLGSHHISYDLRLSYTRDKWALQGYHQHLCYDKSGMELYNGADGLWGLQLDLPQFTWLSKVVIEYFSTKNGSGPFHYIEYDHEKYPGHGGGGDNYYNNDEYISGNSYFNRGVGSPLVPSPEYNRKGELGFLCNRVQDWHIGAEGKVSSQLSYRLLVTVMNGWGTARTPYLKKREGVSYMLDLSYTHPSLPGWNFSGAIAGDTGNMFGDKGIGFNVSISKQGILKSWK